MRPLFLLLFTFLALSMTGPSADLIDHRAKQDYALFFSVNAYYGAVMSAQADNRQGKDYALFFAVEDYDHMGKLSNPIDNATAIAEELRTDYGFQTELVKDPTFAQVAAKIAEYQRKFASGSYDQKGQLLIFFTGHGVQRGNNGYFLPKDGNPNVLYQNVIEYDNWRYEIDQIECQHILVTIDACYSLSFDPNWRNKTDRNFGRRGDKNKDQVRLDHEEYWARLFITSDGTGNQTPDRSSLARQFLTGLRTHRGVNGYLSSEELYASYLSSAAPVPGGGDFGRDEPGSRFLFFRNQRIIPDKAKNDLADWRIAEAQNDCAGYRLYVRKHSNGDFVASARQRIAPCEAEERMLAAWVTTKNKNDCNSYERFAADYPSSPYARLVPKKLKELKCGSTKVSNQFGKGDNIEKPVNAISNKANAAFVKDNMTKVTGGNFTLGCSIGRVNCENDEFPEKDISISSFYIQRNEVTNNQFLAFLEAYKSDKVKSGKFVGQKMIYPSTSGLSNRNGKWSIKKGYENHPVVDVTWYGAMTFANFYGLRLPTEAEWEFIAKGGKANDKYVFSGSDNLYNTGVYEGNSNFDSATVGSKGSTHILGVNDMSGNVWEWCDDWYTPNYNSITSSNPTGPRSGTTKLIRGGSYSEGEWQARVTNRAHKTPVTHANNIGFRCAK